MKKFDEKDNALINKIAEYFKEKYGTSIVAVSNGQNMTLVGKNYSSEQAIAAGIALVKEELKGLAKAEDEESKSAESKMFAEIMSLMGKED